MADRESKPFGVASSRWIVLGILLFGAAGGVYALLHDWLVAPTDRLEQAEPQSALAASEFKKALIPVEGMSCGACAARVKGTLKGMDGVADVEVSLAERSVRVRYADQKVTPERLAEAINELGYKASVPAARKTGTGASQVETAASADAEPLQAKTVTIPVDGMACEYCAQSVKERLAGIDGVKDVGIRLKEKEARVQYVKGKVTPQRLVEEIAAQGFKAGTPTVKEE